MNKHPILRANNLTKSYKKRRVVHDVSFDVFPGEIVGLLGPNGAGKSTSFNMIAGLVIPDAGHVWLDEHELAQEPLYQRARMGLGYLPQESTVFRGLSVLDNLLAIFETQKISPSEAHQEAHNLLKRYNLLHVENNLGQQLSGGERRRLEMARCLITRPRVVLLDEPFAGVDPIAVGEIKNFIVSLKEEGLGVLLTDHNVRETLTICDRAYIISNGRILVGGSPDVIVANDIARATYLGADFKL